MFRLKSIQFNNGEDKQIYVFTAHSFVWGPNTVGKTALTKAIDYILGSNNPLSYQGLDNIESIEAHLTNESTDLWLKRTISGSFFYKRTTESQYSEVSQDVYKDNICLMICSKPNTRFTNVYNKVFEERPTFRSFNFLNYIDEKGLGDLSVVFTKAKELKHQIRIQNIMRFFFNYENIEQIYEKEVQLEQVERDLETLKNGYLEYTQSRYQLKKLFSELQLPYSDSFADDLKTFEAFKNNYIRKTKSTSKDLIYLTKASFSLAEEIKLYTFMKNQSANMVERRERIKRLLTIFHTIVENHSEYENYAQIITRTISGIEDENLILSLTDYGKAIRDINSEKEKLDEQIIQLRAQAAELQYEVAIKKVGLIEHAFAVISRETDVEKITHLQDEAALLKNEIKTLKSAFDRTKIERFNKQLTDLYLKSDLKVKHLEEDRKEIKFALDFDPFRLCLFAHKFENERETCYTPGSMTRQTHLQMLIYLNMFRYLKEYFPDFICLPLLVIDSANQPMEGDVFRELYPVIIDLADEFGVQTIFMSKDRLEYVPQEDFVDISSGLNKFHRE